MNDGHILACVACNIACLPVPVIFRTAPTDTRRNWEDHTVGELNRAVLFTNEYPPNIYGGAGVHVEYLSKSLAKLIDVEVRAFGDQNEERGNLRVRGYQGWDVLEEGTDPRFKGALNAMSRNLRMAKDPLDAQVVHAHTWYADMAAFYAKTLWKVPMVASIHSLEPLRPWKEEQLGNAYHMSSWMERTGLENSDSIIAVSQGTRQDVLDNFDVPEERIHVIHNGIDLAEYVKATDKSALEKYGVDPDRPYVLFVGRIARQKGIIHLVEAIPQIDPDLQVVLLAGQPDTAEIGQEMSEKVADAAKQRDGIIWIDKMVSREEAIQFYSHADVFCCPSVYEPFGIINLEAMACETAVVAAKIGGIPEVVVPEETGLLIDLELKPGTFEPVDTAGYAQALADGINRLARDPDLRAKMGKAGRKRVEDHFSWDAIAERTVELYRSLVE
jgi:alpha-maltose-1-phosphate synthase